MNSRAWIELNLDNLENNVKEIRKKINKETEIMAVLKANAYGHGDVLIAKKLNNINIKNFAVASLEEGINLKKNNIEGNILILGYTPIKKVNEIIKYNLIQTIVDDSYAIQIQEELKKKNIKEKLNVHIKINTGMNRIGIRYNEIDRIDKIYQCSNLNIIGVFSHLAIADSKEDEAKIFTENQFKQLNQCIQILKEKGYDTGKEHIQSSYGMLNYSNYKFDYVRTGLFIYGIQEENREDFKLEPVLSLKATIESIHEIEKNESVGYGRSYISKEIEKIAAISIGYADGYPRNLSNQDTKVIVKGEYATIVGRICMDQLMIKIPKNVDAKPGDIVTLIGKENNRKITVNELAKRANTIPYEIISRLGNRLDRIIV